MQKAFCALAMLGAGTVASAASVLPTSVGTSWEYQMTQEFAPGVRPSADEDVTVDADGKVRAPVTIAVTGMEKIDGVEVYRYELRRREAVKVIQFLEINGEGMFERARGDGSGARIKIEPPQKLLSFPLKVGEKWEYHGGAGGESVEETYEIVAREKIRVPAGEFEAYHLHVIGTQPFNSVVDRWYVPEVGEIKDVTEVQRPNGSMVQRLSFELTKLPKLAKDVAAAAAVSAKKLAVILASHPDGEMTTVFSSDVSKLYARWQGEGLPGRAQLRAVWIAEDVGKIAPPNYKVDEVSVSANGPRAQGVFTLSRPTSGWPAGQYRVEIYIGDELAETIKFKMGG